MKQGEKRGLNIEKETKRSDKNAPPKNKAEHPKEEPITKKVDPSSGQTQYPEKVGFHGTDDEKELSPEE
jgi:hypothetical protein